MKTIHLVPPALNDTHIDKKITCIRGHKERLFRIALERQSGRLIIHNYGQGGAGWTFLFGCVNESLRQFYCQLILEPLFNKQPITVIGAGCYGLLTAILLARDGHDVIIIAQALDNLTSHKAVGFFFPRPRKSSTLEEKGIFERTGIESYITYAHIMQGTHPFIKNGVQLLPAYFSPSIDPGFAPYHTQDLIKRPEAARIHFGTGRHYDALEYQLLCPNPTLIMQELMHEVQRLGIRITIKSLTNFNELETPVIFNCAGLGAQALTNDPRMVPVQGHLITLKNQPDMNQLQYLINMIVTVPGPKGMRDEIIYFAPKDTGILGTTFLRGQADPQANAHEFDRLLSRCRDFFQPQI